MMGAEKILPVAMSVAVIVLVAVAQERSRELAAVFAVMPITIPLAVWIVFSRNGGDHAETARFVADMFVAYLPTVVFLAALWFGFRRAWSLPLVLASSFAAWAVLVALPHLVRRLS